jgi:F420-non-reducing hydrogenase iron-sulfur subunit
MARHEVIKLLLEDVGINPERAALEWVSGAEAPQFAQKVTSFTQKIKELGPNKFGVKEVETCQ